MIWLVLVVLAGGAGLAWFLDRELNPRDHRSVRTVTVTIHADIGPLLEALDRIRNANLDRSTTMTDTTPSITIPGVPETITRDQYVALIESVGFRANDLASLRFTPEGIFAEVFARNAEGAKIIDHSAEVNDAGITATVKHTVFVRIEDAKIHEVTA